MNELRQIIIIGNSIEAWLPAAYLRSRLPSDDYHITLIETAENSLATNGDILARPSSKNLHHVIGLTEHDLGAQARARPALCASITNNNNTIVELPFGNYGIDRAGTEFQHLWKLSGSQKPLSEFNLALAMHKASLFMPEAPNGAPSYDYGYILEEQGYVDILKSKANAQHIVADIFKIEHGVHGIDKIICDDKDLSADLYIDARNIDYENAWQRNHLKITGNFDKLDHQSGMRLHRIQMAMERLFKLWPDKRFAAIEIDEYNRLEAAQSEHINDMNILLSQDIQNCSEALNRKIRLFEKRGRIAMEDYEIYSKAEWIAALSAAGIVPQNYDRLALKMDSDTLAQWTEQLHAAIANVVKQLSDKRIRKQ